MLSTDKKVTITDTYPQNIFGRHPLKWIQDLLAPFYLFMKMKYTSHVKQDDNMMGGGTIMLESRADQQLGNNLQQKMTARVVITNGKLQAFRVELSNKQIEAICGN